MGGHGFRPVGFSPHSAGVITAAARDRICAFFPRVFLRLHGSRNAAGQLLIYPVGEIPELSERSSPSSFFRPLGTRGLRSAPGLSTGAEGAEGAEDAEGAEGAEHPSLLPGLPQHGSCSPSSPSPRGEALPARPRCVLRLLEQSRPALCW